MTGVCVLPLETLRLSSIWPSYGMGLCEPFTFEVPYSLKGSIMNVNLTQPATVTLVTCPAPERIWVCEVSFRLQRIKEQVGIISGEKLGRDGAGAAQTQRSLNCTLQSPSPPTPTFWQTRNNKLSSTSPSLSTHVSKMDLNSVDFHFLNIFKSDLWSVSNTKILFFFFLLFVLFIVVVCLF